MLFQVRTAEALRAGTKNWSLGLKISGLQAAVNPPLSRPSNVR